MFSHQKISAQNCLMHRDQSFNCWPGIMFLLYWLAGKTRARDAALNAIQSPLLDIGIERATGIVWSITGGTDLTLFEVGLLLWVSWLNLILLLFYILHNRFFGSTREWIVSIPLNASIITMPAAQFTRMHDFTSQGSDFRLSWSLWNVNYINI